MKDTINNVLIVEDNEDFQLILSDYLDITPFDINHIDYTTTLKETLNLISKNDYDLIFLDIVLPDNTTLDSISQIKSIDDKVAIIVLTSNDNLETSFEAIQKGAQDYIIKGDFNEKQLTQSIIHAIERADALNKLKEFNKNLDNLIFERTALLEDALNDLRMEVDARQKVELELLGAKKEIATLYSQEKEISELRSNFITTISHEFRVPLQEILTSSYLISYMVPDKDVKFLSYLESIRKMINKMTKTLDKIILIDESNFNPNHTETKEYLCTAINEVIFELINQDESNNRIVLDHEGDYLISSYDQHLSLIFVNIFTNALKYSNKGSIINTNVFVKDNFIITKVRNEGIGIPKNQINLIFNDFYRAKNVRDNPGTGLGLSLAKRCVEEINGEISVDSVENEWCEFTLKLPLLKTD